MAPDSIVRLVCLHHHGERVPPHETLDTSFDLAAAGKWWLFCGGNGVDVRSVCGERWPDALPLSMIGKLTQQTTDARRPTGLQDIFEGLEPFAGFESFEL